MPKIPINKMTVDKEIRRFWLKEYEHGDIQRIHEISKVDKRYISSAIGDRDKPRQTCRCSEETFNAINDYFLAKRERRISLEKEIVEKYNKQS